MQVSHFLLFLTEQYKSEAFPQSTVLRSCSVCYNPVNSRMQGSGCHPRARGGYFQAVRHACQKGLLWLLLRQLPGVASAEAVSWKPFLSHFGEGSSLQRTHTIHEVRHTFHDTINTQEQDCLQETIEASRSPSQFKGKQKRVPCLPGFQVSLLSLKPVQKSQAETNHVLQRCSRKDCSITILPSARTAHQAQTAQSGPHTAWASHTSGQHLLAGPPVPLALPSSGSWAILPYVLR